MSGMRAPRAEVAVDSLGKGPEKGQETHTCVLNGQTAWVHSWHHFKQSESGRSYFHRFFFLLPKKGGGGDNFEFTPHSWRYMKSHLEINFPHHIQCSCLGMP